MAQDDSILGSLLRCPKGRTCVMMVLGGSNLGSIWGPFKIHLDVFLINFHKQNVIFFANRVLKEVHFGAGNWSPFDSAER